MSPKNEAAIRIVHVSTLHRRDDVRIFYKEANTLAVKLNAELQFCVQDGLPDEGGMVGVVSSGDRIRSLPVRVTVGLMRMYRLVARQRPNVVHIHDPELIPLGIILKMRGVKIIQDVHEDYRKVAREKANRSPVSRCVLQFAVVIFEFAADRVFDAVVCATEVIARNFKNKNTIVVKNYPDAREFPVSARDGSTPRLKNVTYIGGITKIRGIMEMVSAVGQVKDRHVRLLLAGEFSSMALRESAESLSGWSRVEYYGWADRSRVSMILAESCAGLVILHPHGNYVESLPTKMFEYMAAGIPVIISNFPVFKEIIEKYECGIAVDPFSSEEIANAIDWIVSHPERAEEMGCRGRAAIENEMNWANESDKLIALYENVAGAVKR